MFQIELVVDVRECRSSQGPAQSSEWMNSLQIGCERTDRGFKPFVRSDEECATGKHPARSRQAGNPHEATSIERETTSIERGSTRNGRESTSHPPRDHEECARETTQCARYGRECERERTRTRATPDANPRDTRTNARESRLNACEISSHRHKTSFEPARDQLESM